MMRFVSALGGFLLVGGGVAAGLDECADDAVLKCFSSSLPAASAFCSQSVTWGEAIMVTVTPTITSTQVVTITTDHVPSSTGGSGISITSIVTTPNKRKKRGTCTKRNPSFSCLRTLTRTTSIDDHGFTSACSCIGAATATVSTTTVEPTTVTITETSFTQQPVQPTASSSTWPSNAPSSTPPSSSWCQASTVVSTVTETMAASVVVSTITATHISEEWSVGISTTTDFVHITTTDQCSAAVQVTATATETVTETATETNTLTEVSWAPPITETTTTTQTLWASAITTDTASEILPSLATSFFTQTQTETVTATDSCSMRILPSTSVSISISISTTTEPGPTQTITSTTTLYSSTLSTTTTLTKTATLSTTTTTKTTTSTATVMYTTIPDTGITNGAFEGGSLTGWDSILLGSNPSANVTSPGAYGVGNGAAYLSAGSPSSSVTLYQYLSCTAGKKYKLTFDAKRGATSAQPGGWSVSIRLGVPRVVLESGFIENQWTSYTKIITCTEDLNGRLMQLVATASQGGDGSGRCAVWFDNFNLIPLSA